jgi:hypothetical protein
MDRMGFGEEIEFFESLCNLVIFTIYYMLFIEKVIGFLNQKFDTLLLYISLECND